MKRYEDRSATFQRRSEWFETYVLGGFVWLAGALLVVAFFTAIAIGAFRLLTQ